MEYHDEISVKALHVTEELDVAGTARVQSDKVVGKLPYIPQSEDYPVKGLRGLREQVDALLEVLKVSGLMYASIEDGEATQ